MAVTITSDLVDISACNSAVDGGTHYRLAGTTSANPGADPDAMVQGSGCIANKMGSTTLADVGGHFNSTATFDITGKHLFHWRQIVTAGNMEPKASKGISIGLTNTSVTSNTAWSTTNYKLWYLDGKDTAPIAQGWIPYVLDPASAADLSAGTLTLGTVKNVGLICRQTSSVTSTVSNQFYDALRMGTGLTATASSAGDTITFASLYATDGAAANAWGIITKTVGVYFGGARMSMGSASQTNTCLFKDTSAVLVWRNAKVASTLYGFSLVGASGQLTTFQLGDKDGSGNTASGCVVRGEGAAVWSITCGANSGFKAYASSLTSLLSATLSATSELKDSVVASSGTLDVNGATLTGCTFSGHTATQLKVDSAAEMALITGCAFGSAGTGHAIEITAPGAYTFSALTFAGYAASNGSTGNEAIYNNSGGAVTVNVSGGSTPSYRNGAGASTTVNNTVALTVSAQLSLAGAEIRVYDMDNSPAGSLGSELAGSESNAGATFVYSGSGGNVIWLQIMLPGYREFGQQLSMPSVSGPLAVTLQADNNL